MFCESDVSRLQNRPMMNGDLFLLLLNREQWLGRCAARFRVVARLDAGLAMQMAEAQLENLKGDLAENPEQAADDGGSMEEQKKFPGLWTCLKAGCDGLELTDVGSRSFHEALGREAGLSADQIIATWNAKCPIGLTDR